MIQLTSLNRKSHPAITCTRDMTRTVASNIMLVYTYLVSPITSTYPLPFFLPLAAPPFLACGGPIRSSILLALLIPVFGRLGGALGGPPPRPPILLFETILLSEGGIRGGASPLTSPNPSVDIGVDVGGKLDPETCLLGGPLGGPLEARGAIGGPD